MKNEKHVDTANEIFEYLYEHVEAPSFVHEGDNWKTDVKKKIISALQQVEAEVYEHLDIPQIRNDSYKNGFERGRFEALASKVVGPSDEDIEAQASKYSRDIEFEHPYGDFKNGAKWVLSQLTLAPKEPEVKAQGFEE